MEPTQPTLPNQLGPVGSTAEQPVWATGSALLGPARAEKPSCRDPPTAALRGMSSDETGSGPIWGSRRLTAESHSEMTKISILVWGLCITTYNIFSNQHVYKILQRVLGTLVPEGGHE